jgi:hypothetical protein
MGVKRSLQNMLNIPLSKDFPNADLICVCRVAHKQVINGIMVLPWQEALGHIGF